MNWVFIKIVARLIADALKLQGCQWMDPVLHRTELTTWPQLSEALWGRN
jgi:hypothetical protein